MIFQIIAIIFIGLSSTFISGYVFLSLSNMVRRNKIKNIIRQMAFYELMGRKSNEQEEINRKHKTDWLSVITISDYSTDLYIRNYIKMAMEDLIQSKKG